jgi:hypothetical protein
MPGRYVWYVDKSKRTACLNATNVFNSAYLVAGYGSGGLAVPAPRTIFLTLTAQFL